MQAIIIRKKFKERTLRVTLEFAYNVLFLKPASLAHNPIEILQL